MPDNLPSMVFKKNNPITIIPINGNMVLAVYKGSLGRFDILLKYRQKTNNKWSRLRTPKHIHWTVDILLKRQQYESLTKEFVDFLLDVWRQITPIDSEDRRQSLCSPKESLAIYQAEIEKFQELNNAGEYSVRFLILLAKLLMIQEKTNWPAAYMFRKLLESIKNNSNLFEIISRASFGGREKK
jgi:hypothetical protein